MPWQVRKSRYLGRPGGSKSGCQIRHGRTVLLGERCGAGLVAGRSPPAHTTGCTHSRRSTETGCSPLRRRGGGQGQGITESRPQDQGKRLPPGSAIHGLKGCQAKSQPCCFGKLRRLSKHPRCIGGARGRGKQLFFLSLSHGATYHSWPHRTHLGSHSEGRNGARG